MTDRLAGVLVTFDDNYRVDDLPRVVVDALKMIKGVASVEPITADYQLQIATGRARLKLVNELWDVLKP
jgi:hypothetical protein